ncbi:MAG: ABC-2 transporter permease [Paraclostridium sp.]|uniref:ABC-2 transporter permease n=1 Tax=Paraclostridium sp. TaxID=2023273 RepID=UPI003F3B88E9
MINIINLTKMSFNNLNSVFKNIWFIGIVWTLIAVVSPSFLSMLFGMGSYLVLYQVLAYEDMHGVDNLIVSLPVKRSEYVVSRYVLGISVSTIVMICLTTIYFFINLINKNEMPIQVYLIIGIISSVVVVSIITPIVIRFGTTKGRLIVLIVAMSIAGAATGFITIINEDLTIMLKITDMINNIGLPIVLVLASIVALGISMMISLKLYKNKELR